MPEQQNIEYKQSWHDDYLKWVCGFANAIGGVIYIGIDDAGNVVHLTDYARLLEEIPNKIRNAMGIICDVQLHDEEENKYISIKVNPYSVAVSLRGRYYYRSGSTKMELTGVELNEFLLKKAGKTWDDVIEEGATVKDIDEASIAKFIEDANEKGRLPETKGLSTFQILEKLKLTDGKKLKRAAIIMFGKEPMRFYPNIQVKIGRFGKDASDLKFHEVVEGNIVQLVQEVQVQLNYKFLTRPVAFEGFQRVEKDQYPIQALREMLLNGLVHRTYMGATIQMRVFDDKLSIWNEGLLPFGLSLEDLKSDHNSRPRNPLIANACFFAGYIDTWGRGTLKIINACKEAGLPEPETKEMNGGVEVTIFNHQLPENSERLRKDFGMISERFLTEFGTLASRVKVDSEINKEILMNNFGLFSEYLRTTFGVSSDEIRSKFGEISLLTLTLIVIDKTVTAKTIAEIIGTSQRTIENHLTKLRKNEIVKRMGSDKSGYYEICKQE